MNRPEPAQNSPSQTLPTLFIPHGGGPCFFMDWTLGPADTWDKMAHWLRNLSTNLGVTPTAIVVISAHWETDIVAVNSARNPPLIYDYRGFPPHTYDLKYSAPGNPELAQQICSLLLAADIPCVLDPDHGLDHGAFIPLMLIYPAANIPVVQVSLHSALDPQQHLSIGQALAPLRQQNILLLGSGMSYHNMAALMDAKRSDTDSDSFDQWLNSTCTAAPEQRNQALRAWSTAPCARQAHPREEHLLPLLVVAGAASETRGSKIFGDRVLGAAVSAFQFG